MLLPITRHIIGSLFVLACLCPTSKAQNKIEINTFAGKAADTACYDFEGYGYEKLTRYLTPYDKQEKAQYAFQRKRYPLDQDATADDLKSERGIAVITKSAMVKKTI